MQETLDTVGTLLLAFVLVRLAWIDLQTFRLPDRYTLPLIAAGLVLALLVGTPPLLASVLGGLVGFALFAAIGELYFRRKGIEGLGLGDAKLFAAAGTWLGWAALPNVLLIAAGGALIYALARRRALDRVAFGPWLALGFLCMRVWTG
ncbi:MAG: A24 family peptidase [Sulfitobacter sp.]|nr:A24 family peptidase [Sulfitobacter sp.]